MGIQELFPSRFWSPPGLKYQTPLEPLVSASLRAGNTVLLCSSHGKKMLKPFSTPLCANRRALGGDPSPLNVRFFYHPAGAVRQAADPSREIGSRAGNRESVLPESPPLVAMYTVAMPRLQSHVADSRSGRCVHLPRPRAPQRSRATNPVPASCPETPIPALGSSSPWAPRTPMDPAQRPMISSPRAEPFDPVPAHPAYKGLIGILRGEPQRIRGPVRFLGECSPTT